MKSGKSNVYCIDLNRGKLERDEVNERKQSFISSLNTLLFLNNFSHFEAFLKKEVVRNVRFSTPYGNFIVRFL